MTLKDLRACLRAQLILVNSPNFVESLQQNAKKLKYVQNEYDMQPDFHIEICSLLRGDKNKMPGISGAKHMIREGVRKETFFRTKS